ncbi:MAG TPA: hypothetical protein VIZ70_05265 [Propionibacteriaceae bacterium]
MDILLCDQEAVNVLSRVFGFHPIAVRDCTERNHVSKVHIYPDYVFSVLHAPKLGKRGHVRYVELDQFVGPKYLVTEARHDHTRKGVADMQAHSSAQATKAGRAPVSNHTMRAGRRHRRG